MLEDDGRVLYETGAIVLHLVDTHPAGALAPPPGSAERADFLTWLFWLSSTWQPQAPLYFYSERYVASGDSAAIAEIKAGAEQRIGGYLDQIDARLARQPWMGGDRFSALDPYTFMLCRWTRQFARPARELPHVGPYLARVLERPSVREVLRVEGIAPPLV